MKALLNLFALFLTAFLSNLCAQTPITGNPAELPFTLEMEEVTQDEIPGFHSMAFAEWNGYWIIVAGRIGGLHGFFPFTAFPDSEANTNVWLIDPQTGETHQFPVDNLNIPYRDPLQATNPQYTQSNGQLYIVGGYGKDQSTNSFRTFSVVTVLDLQAFTSAMLGNTNPSTAFKQAAYSGMNVCGGEMDKIGDYFYLVGGHDFSGNYAQSITPLFSQIYTYQIKKFRIETTPTSLTVEDYSEYTDEQNLRRRDFTLAPLIRPDGAPALCLYGGVFRANADLPFYNPVYIAEDSIFNMDSNYEQLFSQYTCPAIPMYDSSDQAMYTLFFGGLSVHFWNTATQSIIYDEKVPFIKDITTFRRLADGSSREFIMPQRFDALLGTNMVFALAPEAPHYPNEVLKLKAMTGKTFVGYLFGGIKADIPNITTSKANNRMFKVFITPQTGVGTDAPDTDLATVFPNPITGQQTLRVQLSAAYEQVILSTSSGQVLQVFQAQPEWQSLERYLQQLGAGVYYLRCSGKRVEKVIKVIKI